MIDRLLGREPPLPKDHWFLIQRPKYEWGGSLYLTSLGAWGHQLKDGKVIIAFGDDLHYAEYWGVYHGIWWKKRRWNYPEKPIQYGRITDSKEVSELIMYPDQFVLLATL